jgi:hypothetical protein
MIPTTIPASLAALNAAYATLGEDDAFALASALEQASPVNTIVQAFDVLRLVPSLDDAGLIALAGCARLIASNAWHGRGGDATTLLIDRAAQLAALPQPEAPPVVPAPPPSLPSPPPPAIPEAMGDIDP